MDSISKQKILDNTKYSEVTNYIKNYNELAIDCELELHKIFHDIDKRTLSSILTTEINYKTRSNYHKWIPHSAALLQKFEKESSTDPRNSEIIVKMAQAINLSPTVVCRILVSEKYKTATKSKITEWLKNYYLIEDSSLALNIRNSVCSDNQEGPITDIIRRCIGEEYEIKLKEDAKSVGVQYVDEAVLRRTGFDKTPDLKLAIPCLYKGNVINWIESKALFGDIRTHKRYLVQQLASYSNRFGGGIVIYWFGFQKDILDLKENGDCLIILDKFPEKENLEFLKMES